MDLTSHEFPETHSRMTFETLILAIVMSVVTE